jgi:hypothetical protein
MYLEKLLSNKKDLLATLSALDYLLKSKDSDICINNSLIFSRREEVCAEIVQVLIKHKDDIEEDLREIDRKLKAVDDLLGEWK